MVQRLSSPPVPSKKTYVVATKMQLNAFKVSWPFGSFKSSPMTKLVDQDGLAEGFGLVLDRDVERFQKEVRRLIKDICKRRNVG